MKCVIILNKIQNSSWLYNFTTFNCYVLLFRLFLWKYYVIKVLQIPLPNSTFSDVTLWLEISPMVSVFTPWKWAIIIHQYFPHPHWKRLTNCQNTILRFISNRSKYFPNILTCYFRKEHNRLQACWLNAARHEGREPSAAAHSPGKRSIRSAPHTQAERDSVCWRSSLSFRAWHDWARGTAVSSPAFMFIGCK